MGFKSLLCSSSPIPELCVVCKNEMGTTEDIFWGGGGGNCRWQTCVQHMCNRGCSPARNDPLSFLSSHVSRSVSPTTTSQIQARKKRRGVSVLYDDQSSCVPWSGWPCVPGVSPCVNWGAVGPSLLLGHSAKSLLHPSCRALPKANFFSPEICPQTWQKRREQFPLGLPHQFTFLHSAFAPPKTFKPRALPKAPGGL